MVINLTPHNNSIKKYRIILFLIPVFIYSCGCAAKNTIQPYDPFEPINRKIYQFNRSTDKLILEPVAKGYRRYTPKLFRTGVKNFVYNLSEPINIFNNALQLKWKRTGDSLYRFGVNSIWGVFGIIDIAKIEGIPIQSEDFGQTLAAYGIPAGPYLMVPFLGPMTGRQLSGRVVDSSLFSQLNTYLEDKASYVFWSRPVFVVLTQREGAIETIENIRRNAIDEYALVRNAYYTIRSLDLLDKRTNLLQGNQNQSFSTDKLDSWDDLDDLDDFE